MSNSIWKIGNLQKADTRKQILFYAGGGRFPYYGWNCPKQGVIGSWVYDDVQKWCYVDDLIAQADKAERLEEENEAMREEFEVWHGNHKCVLEDKERLQKAVDYVYKLLLEEANFTAGAHLPNKYQQKIFEIIKQLIKGE